MKNIEPKNNIYEEQKRLVLARFKTLNPNSKIMLGGENQISVKEIIEHIEDGSELGKRCVNIQIKMLQILASNVG